MSAGHVYRVTQVVGSSDEGVDEAIRSAIRRTGATVRNLDWFVVREIRGYIEGDAPRWVQVSLDIGFRVEEPGGDASMDDTETLASR